MAGGVGRAGISAYAGGSDTGLNRIPHTAPGGRVIAVCRNRTGYRDVFPRERESHADGHCEAHARWIQYRPVGPLGVSRRAQLAKSRRREVGRIEWPM
jgi:hypothetical protein